MRNKQIKLLDTSALHEKSDGLIYYEKKPFTGSLEITGDREKVQKKGKYLDGKRHGVWIEITSQFVTTIFYEEGELAGITESSC